MSSRSASSCPSSSSSSISGIPYERPRTSWTSFASSNMSARSSCKSWKREQYMKDSFYHKLEWETLQCLVWWPSGLTVVLPGQTTQSYNYGQGQETYIITTVSYNSTRKTQSLDHFYGEKSRFCQLPPGLNNKFLWGFCRLFVKDMKCHLDLIDVDVLEFFLHFLGAHLHGVHRRLRVLQRLRRVVRLLHVERLTKKRTVILC